jgi:hypothetical protein
MHVPTQAADIAASKNPNGKTSRVYINAEQKFEGISPAVWQMRTVCALAATRKLMAKIDDAIETHGGWPLK